MADLVQAVTIWPMALVSIESQKVMPVQSKSLFVRFGAYQPWKATLSALESNFASDKNVGKSVGFICRLSNSGKGPHKPGTTRSSGFNFSPDFKQAYACGY